MPTRVVVEVEVAPAEAALLALPRSDVERWVKQSFAKRSCERVEVRGLAAGSLRARVTLGIGPLPPDERALLAKHPRDARLWSAYVEKMFHGRGACRVASAPVVESA